MNNGRTTTKISFVNSFFHFKDKKKQDVYNDFFYLNKKELSNINDYYNLGEVFYSNWATYKNLKFNYLNKIISTYFNPSAETLKRISFLEEKYNFNWQKTIAVQYRGTDKYLECKLVDPLEYIKLVEEIIVDKPDYRVMIQTDQKQVLDLFLDKFGSRCFYFTEMPQTESKLVMHKIIKDNKLDFSFNIEAVTRIQAKAEYLILGSGNMAFMTSVYRGHPKNLYQFDLKGNLIRPNF
jgi:hypothetical protein